MGVSAENITVCCEFDSRVYKRINVLTILSLSLSRFGSVGDLFNQSDIEDRLHLETDATS